ncbi:hypothetical protein FOA43_001205 [Brettanomyces nanus]|uniref:Major facilitator superfamily (MFS) profile domain-containing protein n=1 Tax=Eeniella nana TaxID=13502 RepID=A0A875RNL5_EENNA|nr:uncharacterized protein FOA43_001205 [Brettanomyces nanus]QPG73890.1 hypothetical protein FOA43_001205 [Brettanomyces nanus]
MQQIKDRLGKRMSESQDELLAKRQKANDPYEFQENTFVEYGSVFDGDESDVLDEISNGYYPNFFWIELSLFANVFLSGFDGTVTASTYTTIGDEFKATNTASWITTSYLITSTAFQPLYGSFSDILGRRSCLIGATSFFIFGCIGCSFSSNIIMLDVMRALTGVGGGGLVTLATIVNSDIIAPEQRGNWQAFQNLLLGFGGICGASFGGVIAETFGWRWCFLLQAPIGFTGVIIGYFFIQNPPRKESFDDDGHKKSMDKIDFQGSITLVLALSLQLLVLSVGGSQLAWSDIRLIGLFVLSCLFMLIFAIIEIKTKALPIIPPVLLHDPFGFIILGVGIMVGIASYAYLFILPLLFRIVLGDNISQAGLRLTIPSLFTPVGGLIAGYFMSKGANTLFKLVSCGALLMFLGNFLALKIDEGENPWVLGLYLVPANIGQGIIFPSSLFSFIYIFDKDKQAIATSTAYLFRSIGSVWGVAGSSTIIRHVLKIVVSNSLSHVPGLSKKDIAGVVEKVSQDISSIETLEPEIAFWVNKGYATAIREAQAFSTLCCFICLSLCGLKVLLKIKSRSSYD